jgi:hypothetical protein
MQRAIRMSNWRCCRGHRCLLDKVTRWREGGRGIAEPDAGLAACGDDRGRARRRCAAGLGVPAESLARRRQAMARPAQALGPAAQRGRVGDRAALRALCPLAASRLARPRQRRGGHSVRPGHLERGTRSPAPQRNRNAAGHLATSAAGPSRQPLLRYSAFSSVDWLLDLALLLAPRALWEDTHNPGAGHRGKPYHPDLLAGRPAQAD